MPDPRVRVLLHPWRLLWVLSMLGAWGDCAAATVFWTGAAGDGSWSNPLNWAGGVVPADGDDVDFGASGSLLSTLNYSLQLGSFTLDSSATAIATHVGGGTAATLTLTGTGIVNNTPYVPGGNPQDFFADAGSGSVGATLLFSNTASVGGDSTTTLTASGATVAGGGGGNIVFAGSSSTDIGRNTNSVVAAGATVAGAGSGTVTFRDNSLAQDSTQMAANGGVGAGALGGQITVMDQAQLENVIMVLAGENGGYGGRLDFHNTAVFSGLLQNYGATSSLAGGEAVTRFFDNSTYAGAAENLAGSGAGFAGGRIEFHGNAVFDGGLNSADINNQGSAIAGASSGRTLFYDDSSAGQSAGIVNDTSGVASSTGTMGGVTEFHDRSHAGQLSIINEGANASVAGTLAGRTLFFDTSSAESANITNNPGNTAGAPGGETVFGNSSTAGNATIAAYGVGVGLGGQILFQDSASGGTARIITNAGGIFDMSALTTAGMTVGSLEGGGSFLLGSKTLTVGGNNLSTEVTGVISDGGQAGGTGGALTKAGTGTLTLSGANTYTGATAVNGGTLYVNGSIQGSGVTVGSGGTLGGTGSINAPVVVTGALSPGGAAAPGVLTVNGNLTLGAASNLNYRLGATGVVGGPLNDLLTVSGNLTLGGTLNVADSGGFGLGVYRLINYGGALTDNGLALGAFPAGTPSSYFSVQAGAGQVNLVLGGTEVQFWDGAQTAANGVVNGGTGTWNNATTNWTNFGGTANSAWNGRFAVFSGAAGTVTVTEPVTSTGMQFSTSGYTVNSSGTGAIALSGAATIRTDPGTATTINAPLTGSGSLTKLDIGTLTLGGNSTYSGGTTIQEGLVIVTNAAGLGLGTGPVLQLASGTGELDFVQNASAGSVSITNVGAPSTDVSAFVQFKDNSTAGSATINNQGNTAGGGFGGQVNFVNASSAGNAVITNAGSAFAPPAGVAADNGAGITLLENSATAGSATFLNTAGLAANTEGGRVLFADSTSAGASTITNQGGTVANGNGGLTDFRVSATAGTATFFDQAATVSLGNGGTVNFRDNSSAGSATFTQAGSSVPNDGTSLGVGIVTFYDASSAANGTFFNQGAAASNTYGGGIFFRDTSSAGAASITNENGVASGGAGGGHVVFANTASAGSAAITSEGGSMTALDGGYTNFIDSAAAGSATLTAAGATAAGAGGGRVSFFSTSTAGAATIHDGGGTVAGAGSGQTNFYNNSTAGSATLYADAGVGTAAGGGIVFHDSSSGGTARAIIGGTGSTSGGLDISQLTNPSMTIGSIEGTGIVSLGSRNLIVGTNNLSTTFSGLIRDGGFINATGGTLSKTGTGSLTLTGANTYTGGTVITGGALIVTNSAGLALGTGSVTNNPTAIPAGEPYQQPAGSLRFTGNGSAGSVAISNLGTANSSQESATAFHDTATAGAAKITNQASTAPFGTGGSGGETFFYDNATAGSATITNVGGVSSSDGFAGTIFYDRSSAATSTITNGGGQGLGLSGGTTLFDGNFPIEGPTAGNSTIIAEGGAVSGAGGGAIVFQGATAGNATLIAEDGLGTALGGTVRFVNASSGGTARAIIQGGAGYSPGEMNIANLSTPGMTIGSIEGGGVVTLGSKNLQVGGNGLATTFSGEIRDGPTGSGGSLTVAGPGASLRLTSGNIYTGGTTIGDGVNANSGKLIAANVAGSATGSGPVVVNRGGTLGGNGFVAGPVTLNAGGLIAPGDPSTLTIQGNLTWNGGGVIQLVLGPNQADSDFVSILGHLIHGTDGQFRFNLINDGFVPGQEYQLIGAGELDGFSASNFSVSGAAGNFALVDGALDFSGVAAPVPEPATVWLILGGGLLIGGLTRRRAARAPRRVYFSS